MKFRSVIHTIALSVAAAGSMAISSASLADRGDTSFTPNCTALVHTNMRIMPTYTYRPNGQSSVRVYMATHLVNSHPSRVYYVGENGTQPAFVSLEIQAQGKKTSVKSQQKFTKHLAPKGLYGTRMVSERPVDIPLPHQNVDMIVTLTGKVYNSGCYGRLQNTYMSQTYDLRPMLTNGRAKQIGRTRLNHSVQRAPRPGRNSSSAPAPRPRS